MSRIRLLLVDDHALFRIGLSRLLDSESDFQLVAQCATSAEALQALARLTVDLVLLDYDLGKECGLELIRRAREAGYVGRVLIVTGGMSNSDSLRALGHGVCGIFLKTSSPEELSQAIRKVMAGETWIDKSCIQALVRAVRRTGEIERRRQLTDRERDVLKGVLEGLNNREIALSLNISAGSVKSALQQLFVKTRVHTRSQLVRVALEEHAPSLGLNR
jgi:DNA-binding NarL/FixJ family response regulator